MKYDKILEELNKLDEIVVYWDDIVALSPEAKEHVCQAIKSLPEEKTYRDCVDYVIRWMSIVHSKLN